MCLDQMTFNITADTVLKSGRGRLKKVSSFTGGGLFTLHDCAATGNANSGNMLCNNFTGAQTPVINADLPFEVGLTAIFLGGGGGIAVCYE